MKEREQSVLQRKTPLRAKSTLKAKTQLKAKSSLRTNTTLKVKTTLKIKTTIKNASNTTRKKKSNIYKPKYPYESIFGPLDTCYITGSKKPYASIHIHHVFGAANKANSEKYHFLITLRADWHDMADYGIHFNRELDLKIKRLCQDYWLEHYGTKEQFIKIFGKWW